MSRQIRIEGLTPEEVLAAPDDFIDGLVLCDEPLAFKAGTATVLGQFRIQGGVLIVELGHVDGGGEGVIPVLWNLADRYARKRGLQAVDWGVHAVTCAKPNLKLRRVLEKAGFSVENAAGVGDVYRRSIPIDARHR